jgi:hypothetical protein
MTDMHPPPPTAVLLALVTPFNTRFTALMLNLLPMIETEGDSSVPIAPPHAEHAVAVEAAFGQVAVLLSKKLELTARELDVTPIAPPIWAVLLKNLQSLTVTLLPLAETAPPTPLKTLKFAQFWNVMPEMDTAVLTIEKAGPGEEKLQSITVLLLPFKPTILTSEKLLLMITLDSSKYPAVRYTMLAFRDWTA